ncbi:hypothetical protein EV193_109114 [Herbihabitans rhizosphaerae]|uniref:Phosphotransferase family enzyme n=1 Tax=Herbihabitans rhizosphaerae TaxID=1872711 RepID=A0A4V2ERW9_9PSEU|nr:hypothetical protein EV193_109114 [Herbihabitans rhizosphaerae]
MDIAADPPDVTGESNPDGADDLSPEVFEAVATAEAVLKARFGARIALSEPDDLGGSVRSVVARVRVASSPFALPRTLVVKRYVAPTDQPCDSFVREAVSYQLFTALSAEDRMCPELFAHSTDTRLLVLEDLGRAPTLADKLLGNDSRAAERSLLSWARSLGRLHATTAGREADFDALLRRLDVVSSKDPLTVEGRAALTGLPELLESALGVSASSGALDAAERARGLLTASRHRAFSPSDSCPDNNLITSRGVRFLDFEGGCVRNIMLDAAYLRVPFPSCWCSFALPSGMTEAMLAAWRAEVRSMWPDLDEDPVLMPKLLDAQLFWVWLATWNYLPSATEGAVGAIGVRHASPVLPSRGAVLAGRWRRLAEDAALAGVDAVAEHAEAVVAGLERRFGEMDLPLYPAFR